MQDTTQTSKQRQAGLTLDLGGAVNAVNSANGSHIRSNGDVTIAATGGDLNIIGSQIDGNNVALAAANSLNIFSQQENHSLQSSNTNASGGVGIQIGSDGVGFYAQASLGKGSAHGNGTTHAESLIHANDTLTLVSGNDTTIKGAQLTGNRVIGAIGGNLLIQSEQDTDDYASKQQQLGAKAVIGYGSGGSISYNQSKVNSHYQSVNEVSGIQAGSGGLDIAVGDNTHLVGGVIGSTADPSKNLLNTGSLTYESIRNEANYSASSVGVSASYGGGSFSASPSLGIPQGGHSSSETASGIAQSTINVGDGHVDLAGLDRNPTLDHQALSPIFDPQKVQEKMEMGQVAGQVGMRAAGDLAGQMGWSEGSPERTVLHGVVGAGIAALGGGDIVQGALGPAANQFVIQKMADYLEGHGYTPGTPEFASMLQLASTAVGAAVGGGTGAATALDGTRYNYLSHSQLEKANKEWESCRGDQACQARVLSDAQSLSQANDASLRSVCSESPSSDACKSAVSDATAYGAQWGQKGYALQSDMARSSSELMGYLMSTSDGYQYYPTLDGRKDFFQAFQNALTIDGHEVVWPQVAANTSGKLQTVNSWYCLSCGNASAWVNAVGKAIMNFEWPEFRTLYNGPVLTGDAAKAWDAATLINEQQKLQPFYDRLSDQGGWSYNVIDMGGRLNTKSDIFNLMNRIGYGMEQLDSQREGKGAK